MKAVLTLRRREKSLACIKNQTTIPGASIYSVRTDCTKPVPICLFK